MKDIKMIHPKRLFYFSEVFKRGSINAAADRLNMVQAGIGRQIQLLEQELGVLLFERGTRGRGMVPGGQGRGMVPTEAAQIVYEFYCQYCDQQEKMEVALQEMLEMKRGDIRIATFATYIDALIEEVISDFQREHASLNIQIKEIDSSAQITTKVLEDDVHIGIVHCYSENQDIRCYVRAPLPMCLLVNKHHPLATKKKGSFAEIAPYPVILPPTSYDLRRIIHSVEHSTKVRLTSPFTIDSAVNRKKAAIAGYGGVFMSTFAAQQEIKAGQLVPFEIDHPAFTSMEVGLIVRQGRLLPPAVNQLIRLIAGKFSVFKYSASSPISTKTPVSGVTASPLTM